MLCHTPKFVVRVAQGDDDLAAAQRLRYHVFIAEMGGDGAAVDHAAQIEADRFDEFAAHLLLEDVADDAPCRLVGVYRLMTKAMAHAAGGFYSAAEYDLTNLLQSERRVLELGRSCLHPEYRGGAAMLTLWAGLAEYIAAHDIDLLFGVASFQGTDVAAIAPSLSYLHHYHSAPAKMSPNARPPMAVRMDMIAKDDIDRKAAIVGVPTLIKAYLKLGGVVGRGAFVDPAFNTTDVCLILDTKSTRAKTSFGKRAPI